jgi:hypothetical protein
LEPVKDSLVVISNLKRAGTTVEMVVAQVEASVLAGLRAGDAPVGSTAGNRVSHIKRGRAL